MLFSICAACKQVRKNQKKLAKDLETIKSEQKDMESNLKDTFMQYTQNNPPGMAGPGPRKEMTQVQETNRELDSTCLDIVKLIEVSILPPLPYPFFRVGSSLPLPFPLFMLTCAPI